MRQRIAIVGLGHRGLAVLERVLALAGHTHRQTSVLIVEPHQLGVGVHWRDQPEYLWLNTVAGQATAFADATMVDGAPVLGGPPLLTWCHEQGVTLEDDAGGRRPVNVDDFVPRHVWGDYLAMAAHQVLARAPQCATIEIHRGEARQVRAADGERGAVVTLDDGTEHRVDLAFITTGHGIRSDRPVIAEDDDGLDCYPLPTTLDSIAPGQTVAITGMGLTAFDVMAALTVGRGGQFAREGDRLRYRASGAEPGIVLISRTGRFPCARPARPRTTPKTHGRVFTDQALAQARAARPGGRLDFREDVLPLLHREVTERPLGAEQRRLAEAVLATEPPWFDDVEAYTDAMVADAWLDVAEATEGLEASAFKEAMESLRDLRDRLRNVVLSPGLTGQGHRDFFDVVPALANRAAVGPQLARMHELLTLIADGLVRLGPGPAPAIERRAEDDRWTITSTRLHEPRETVVDHLVGAHLVWPRAIGGRDPLATAMREWAAPHPADARYLRLDPDGHAHRLDGTRADGVVVLGPPSEGANYYNNYVMWPGARSNLLVGVDDVLRSLMRGDAAA
jgi:FAD-NAD(P)-binding